jgi:hypothetical protein
MSVHVGRCRIRVSGVTLTAADLASPVAQYAQRYHAEIGDSHHVASPLGAWLVLALAASAARGDERAQLAEMLGVDVNEAAATARALLSDPHPLVGAAAAVWNRPEGSASAAVRSSKVDPHLRGRGVAASRTAVTNAKTP